MKTGLRRMGLGLVCMCMWLLPSVGMGGFIPGIPEYTHTGFPDNSQFPTAYVPAPTNAKWWWKSAADVDTATNLCGPTSAKNSMIWLSDQTDRQPNAPRLAQIKQGDNWVTPANHAPIIEELAELIEPGIKGPSGEWLYHFPLIQDDNYVAGKKEYFKTRGVVATVKLLTMSANSFNVIAEQLKERQDIELSTTEHWFSVVGVRRDGFDDQNANGEYDEGEPVNPAQDYNGNGKVDQEFYIHDPWPTGSNDGWKKLSKVGTEYYLEGWGQPLDTFVVECLLPEPSSILLLGGGLAAAIARRRRRQRSKQAG